MAFPVFLITGLVRTGGGSSTKWICGGSIWSVWVPRWCICAMLRFFDGCCCCCGCCCCSCRCSFCCCAARAIALLRSSSNSRTKAVNVASCCVLTCSSRSLLPLKTSFSLLSLRTCSCSNSVSESCFLRTWFSRMTLLLVSKCVAFSNEIDQWCQQQNKIKKKRIN